MQEPSPLPALFVHLSRLVTDAMLLVSVQGGVAASNAAARALWGLEAGALHGRPLRELVEEEPERLAAGLRRWGRSLEPLPGALVLRRPSGELVRQYCLGSRLEPQGAEPWVLLRLPGGRAPSTFGLLSQKVEELTQEVMRRHRVEEELRRLLELQEQFIGIVSHDIRSPLSAVLMSARQLQRSELEERERQAVARIDRGGRRIEQVVRLLLDFTRVRMGHGIPVSKQRLEVRELCERVVDELKAAWPRRLVVVRGSPVWADVDPERLFQVLVNLVENGFKYGAEGRPVTVETRQEGEELWVEVHNEGEPIAEHLLPRIFEPFSRGRQTQETVKVSLGLGLYIVREIIVAHGGRVEVRSAPELGTTFSVRLPCYEIRAQEAGLSM